MVNIQNLNVSLDWNIWREIKGDSNTINVSPYKGHVSVNFRIPKIR